ncbi:MAG TPA: CvpA family protein [Patescibacteria group bacterium]|nr:CvpA family protein [Patescibacteria group bacterium]
MSALDIIILFLLALFIWKGIRMGLIESVGGIIGLFIGAFMAGRYYDEAAAMLKGLLFGSEMLATILGFLLVFIVVNRAIALLFWVVDKIFNIIAIIPLLKTFNRLLGGLFGLIEGLIFMGIIVFFLSLLPFTGSVGRAVDDSRFAGIFTTVGKLADPFLPDQLINLPFNFGDLPISPNDFGQIPLEKLKDLGLDPDSINPEDLPEEYRKYLEN